MARGDGNIGERVAQGRNEAALVLCVAERKQQGDGECFGSGRERADRGDHAFDLVLPQRHEHSLRAGPLRDRHDIGARDERRRVIAGEVVKRRPVLAPQPQQVFEPLGRHERDAGTAALEQGVRGDRRSMDENVDWNSEGLERLEQREGGINRRGHDLPNLDRPVLRERDEIGERSADVHPYPHRGTSPPPT